MHRQNHAALVNGILSLVNGPLIPSAAMSLVVRLAKGATDMQKTFEDSLVAMAEEHDWHVVERLDFSLKGHLMRFDDAAKEQHRLAEAFRAKAPDGDLQHAILDRLLQAN